jgi:Domain of unknown function (DUF4157)
LQTAVGNRATTRLLQEGRKGSGGSGVSPSSQSKKSGVQRTEAAAADAPAPARRPNRTGIPDRLKSGVESLSGIALDNVRVRFGSSLPAQIGAEAYTHGEEIHIGSGFERHLPHEAWHVVQQAQGRARPTAEVAPGRPINEDRGLEHEADVMGGRATQGQQSEKRAIRRPAMPHAGRPAAVIQAKGWLALDEGEPEELTSEADIQDMGAEALVYLQRGVTPTQKQYLSTAMIRGSHISFQKMLAQPDDVQPQNVQPPSPEQAKEYVDQGRSPAVQNLIEFSTKRKIATKFANESRHGYVFTIRIQRKYLIKGATGAESGWIASQDAPFAIVDVHQTMSNSPTRVKLTDKTLDDAVNNEMLAEYLLAIEGDKFAPHMEQIVGAQAKQAEARKIVAYRRTLAEYEKTAAQAHANQAVADAAQGQQD